MLEKSLVWCGSIFGVMILIPTLIVFIGGFYNPALLESVKNKGVGNIESKGIDDYREQEVIEVLASVIPPSNHIEAIKAQAVIVRTYMLRRELGIVEEGDLTRLSKEDMKALWKGDFEEIYDTYESAAYGTKGEVIFYNEELIEPVYHKESAGHTREAMSLYGMDIPYLKAVESSGDKGSSEKVILKTEVVERLRGRYPNILIDAKYIENQVQIVARDSSGYIQSLQIGNVLLTGEDFRELFGLSSAAFVMTSQGDTLLFQVLGAGHGVGLSQNGANQLALGGKNYKEILQYYYTDVEVRK